MLALKKKYVYKITEQCPRSNYFKDFLNIKHNTITLEKLFSVFHIFQCSCEHHSHNCIRSSISLK